MGTRQIKREVNHTCTDAHSLTHQLTGPWLMQTMYLWYQIRGLCSICLSPFSNIHILLSAQVYVRVGLCVCVYMCVCVCVCVCRGIVSTQLSPVWLNCLGFSNMKKTKKTERIHLVTPPPPLASSRLTPPLTRADSWAKCVRATVPPRQHPCDFDSLLSHFEYTFKVTVETSPCIVFKRFKLVSTNPFPSDSRASTVPVLLKKKKQLFFYQALPMHVLFSLWIYMLFLYFLDLTHILNLEVVVN